MNNNFNTSASKASTKKNIMNLIIFGLAVLTFLLLALTKTIDHFVADASAMGIVKGIFSILIYTLPVAGMALAYLTKKKPSLEFFVNAGALVLGFLVLQ